MEQKIFVPLVYKIDLTFDDSLESFTGQVLIKFEQNNEENELILNFGNNLNIKNVLNCDKNIEYNLKNELLNIKIPKNTKIDEILINYEGKVLTEHKGIFNQNNSIYTQCEPIYARNIFPCIDDPCFRSVFKTTITCNKKFKALSNAMLENVEINGEISKTTFKETIPLPTYLFALAVGDFYHISKQTNDNFPIEVYSFKEMKDYAELVSDLVPNIVEWMTEKTKVKLPGDHLQVLITNDHTGMENFGLVIYGPNKTLANMSKAKESTINDSLENFAHEISHLWMGGVTTFAKWNDLWIKEGFATYFASVIIDDLKPSFKKMEQYISKEYCNVLKRSTKGGERAIIDPSLTNIFDLYDPVSYSKASCVYRMLVNWIGMDKFMDIISVFLKENYLKASSYEVFVNTFSREMETDMKPFFDSWTKNEGIPIIIYENGKISQHYLSETGKWIIPLNIKFYENEKINHSQIMLNKDEIELGIDAEWEIINENAKSLCVILPRGKELEKMCIAAKNGLMSDIEAGVFVVNSRICFDKGLMSANDSAKVIESVADYSSKLSSLPAVDFIYEVCKFEDVDPNLLLTFFEKQNAKVRASASLEKLLTLIKPLLKTATEERIIKILRDNKCGKNVIKQIRNHIKAL